MEIIYFEDLKEGDVFWGDEVAVNFDEMLSYSQLNDPWPIHVDEEEAKRSPYGGIIASGGYTITLMYRSLLGIYNNSATQWAFLGGLDWKLNFTNPVRPGDCLRSKMTIHGARSSSKEWRGVLNSTTEMVNQNGETALSVDVVSFLATRPK